MSYPITGRKENHFHGLPFGQAEARVYQPRRHFKQPQTFLTGRIDFTVLLLFKFLKKHHLPVGQVKNRIHLPDSKIHQPQAIGHYFLCMLNNHQQRFLFVVYKNLSLIHSHCCPHKVLSNFWQLVLAPGCPGLEIDAPAGVTLRSDQFALHNNSNKIY